jgi:phosphate starvation-inducible protein PhoH and related proteins
MEKRLSIKGADQLQLLGRHDAHLRLIESAFGAKVVVRGDEVMLSGEPEQLDKLERLFSELLAVLGRTGSLDIEDVRTVVAVVQAGGASAEGLKTGAVFYGKHGLVRPKTQGQDAYVQAVSRNDIVFVIGPAGTGKTYLAVAMALAKLKEKEISRIILTRPAIEAGESLGFLPGDLMDKVDPYLRPLTDAIFDMLPADHLQRNIDRKIIEIVPLAYMRGRTLNNAFVILDEAQNASAMQMKMFLTRLGINSKAIVTGDVTQIDLPETTASGLIQIQDVLKDIDGIEFVYLGKQDVVRHRLVKEIIQAYEEFQNHTTGEA